MLGGNDAWIERLASKLAPVPNQYVADPVGWGQSKLREHYTRDQQLVMGSVVKNRYTAVKSAHDLGKSFSAARLVAWWLDTHPVGEALAVTTAPTAAQVSAILWREIGKAHRKGKLFGRVLGDNKWKVDWGKDSADEPIAIGRKPADYDPAAFQGLHARYVLVIIDEACGVPKTLYDAIDAIATNKNARVLAIGNPDDPSSHFATICKPGSGWHVIRLDALRSAGFTEERIAPYPHLIEYMKAQKIAPTDEVVPEDLYEMLVDPEWVEERLKRWGMDSPLFTSKVRGEFPTVSIDTLIHPHWVTLAQARETQPFPTMSRIGVDVARYGVNHTIIVLRQAAHARVWADIPYGPTTMTAGKIQECGNTIGDGTVKLRLPVACVDDDGVGGGVVDILEEDEYPVVPIQGGASAIQVLPNGKARFVNKRAELYWNLREALSGPSGTGEDGWLDLDPDDDEMAAQLTNIKYKINRHGQIGVESKDEMAARGLPSPDRADALCYSVAPDEPKMRAKQHVEQMITGDLLSTQW